MLVGALSIGSAVECGARHTVARTAGGIRPVRGGRKKLARGGQHRGRARGHGADSAAPCETQVARLPRETRGTMTRDLLKDATKALSESGHEQRGAQFKRERLMAS